MASVAPTDAPGLLEASSGPSPIAWVLHDGKAGMASQALGLAEATGFPFNEKCRGIGFPCICLPPQLWSLPFRAAGSTGASLQPPWPDLVVACDRNAAMPAPAIRRVGGGRIVAAQIVPEHDRARGARVIVTLGADHRVTQARLAAERYRFPAFVAMPRPILSVLISGTDGSSRLTLRRVGEITEVLAGILRRGGGSIFVTASRWAGPTGLALLLKRLEGLSTAIWDGSGENPYFAYHALADAVLVSADSVPINSEAAATGKPVHILDLDGGNAKFAHFHEAMRAASTTRPFSGRIESWSYSVPDNTARAGAAVRALVLGRRKQA
jgi:mitochondrial fission protein ELM1